MYNKFERMQKPAKMQKYFAVFDVEIRLNTRNIEKVLGRDIRENTQQPTTS